MGISKLPELVSNNSATGTETVALRSILFSVIAFANDGAQRLNVLLLVLIEGEDVVMLFATSSLPKNNDVALVAEHEGKQLKKLVEVVGKLLTYRGTATATPATT